MTHEVEVFKTDVDDRETAKRVATQITIAMPGARVTFDLEDCDRVLRIAGFKVDVDRIKRIAAELGIFCEELV